MKKRSVLYLVLICLLFLSACSSSNSIVGSWEDDSGSLYNFNKDGTLTFETGYISTSGTYSFVDKDTIKIQLEGLLGISVFNTYDVEFQKGEVRLTGSGETIVLRKANKWNRKLLFSEKNYGNMENKALWKKLRSS